MLNVDWCEIVEKYICCVYYVLTKVIVLNGTVQKSLFFVVAPIRALYTRLDRIVFKDIKGKRQETWDVWKSMQCVRWNLSPTTSPSFFRVIKYYRFYRSTLVLVCMDQQTQREWNNEHHSHLTISLGLHLYTQTTCISDIKDTNCFCTQCSNFRFQFQYILPMECGCMDNHVCSRLSSSFVDPLC